MHYTIIILYTNVIFIIIITFFKYLVMRSIENAILLQYDHNDQVYKREILSICVFRIRVFVSPD